MRVRVARWLALALLIPGLGGCGGDATQAEPAARAAEGSAPPATPARTAADTPAPTLTSPPPPPPAPDSGVIALAHEYTQMFYDGKLDLLYQKFSDEMRKILPQDQLSTMYEQVATNYGKESGVIAEDSKDNDDYRAFVRWAHFDKTDEIIEIQWIFHKSTDEVAGFFVRPAQRGVNVGGQ